MNRRKKLQIGDEDSGDSEERPLNDHEEHEDHEDHEDDEDEDQDEEEQEEGEEGEEEAPDLLGDIDLDKVLDEFSDDDTAVAGSVPTDNGSLIPPVSTSQEQTRLEDDFDEEKFVWEHDAISSSNPPDYEDGSFLVQERTVEKILAHRLKQGSQTDDIGFDDTDGKEIEYEYLVKWKGMSYIHTEWVSSAFLESGKMGKSRVQRFLNKLPPLNPEEPFPASLTSVERIAGSRTYRGTTYYLIKWEGQAYSEATWEAEYDLVNMDNNNGENVEENADDLNNAEQIRKYRARNVPKPLEQYKPNPRPRPQDFHQYEQAPTYKQDLTLRSYQLEGLNWLRYCWYNRRNSILADEMGLGKTIQSVAIINDLYQVHNIYGPFLVVVPLSTIQNWVREFERWTDLNVILYHGNIQARDTMKTYEFYFEDGRGGFHTRGPFKFNVLITTYEMLIGDVAFFRSIKWKYCIVDEAHRLKNKASKLTTEILKLHYYHLTLLTGTPIQNNIEELWTLLHILDARSFPRFEPFEKEYGNMKDSSQVQKLQDVLKPYMLRRMKEDVEKLLAPKEETIVEVELTRLQKKYYRAILERNFDHLTKGGRTTNMPSLMNVMLQLRKCCNHPFLLQGVEEHEVQGITDPVKINMLLIEASGKLVLVDKLLPRLKAEKHKVLIFSQMIRVLDILQDYLRFRNYKHERIDGAVRGNERQASIDRFCSPESDVDVFLLCTRAGGVGINLTAADTVIIYDSDWNPQNDIQAQARCHRIGQEKMVKIYRLITRNTYERQMFDRASKKLGLDHAVLTQLEDGNGADGTGKKKRGKKAGDFEKQTQSKQFSSSEVDMLLKNGAYHIFNEDSDANEEAFREENIDQILSRRTTTVVHEVSGAMSTFAKASFASEKAEPDLDINDPFFWEKLMPEQVNKPDPNIIEARRRFNEFGEEVYDAVSQNTRPKKKFSPWNVVSRNKFQKGLLIFGFGRWDKIRHSKKLRPLEIDIARYGKSYVKFLAPYLDMSEEQLLNEIDNSDSFVPKAEPSTKKKKKKSKKDSDEVAVADENETTTTTTTTTTSNNSKIDLINFDDDPSLTDTRFLTKLKANAKMIYGRLKLLARVGWLVRSNFVELGDEWPALDYPDVPWWTETEDKDLLRGIHKHGFGKYIPTSSDPALCFHSKIKPVKKEKKGAQEKCKKKASTKSAETEDDDADNDDDDDEDGKGEAMDVGQSEQSEGQDSQQSQLYDWPGNKWLTLRFKQALKDIETVRKSVMKKQAQQLRKQKKKEKKEKRKLERQKKELQELALDAAEISGEADSTPSSTPSSGKKKKKSSTTKSAKTKQEWSKRELGAFYKVVITHGIPLLKDSEEYDFDFVQEKASLTQKTTEMIKQHYVDFLTQCREVKELKKAGKAQELKEKETAYSLSYVQAKRAVDRISLFTNLRKKVLVLSTEELSQKYNFLNNQMFKTASGLPDWWIPVVHDIALLRGIDKHGIGRWDVIITDPDSSFAQVIQPKLLDAPSQTPDLGSSQEISKKKKSSTATPNCAGLNIPKDKVFFTRIETLLRAVVESNNSSNMITNTISAPIITPMTDDDEIESDNDDEEMIDDDDESMSSAPKKGKKRKSEAEADPGNSKSSKRRKKMDVKRNDKGEIIYPIQLGVLTIENLGTIVAKENYHSDKYIWPVGFKSKREYTSIIDPTKRCQYTCEILDGGEVPLFRITTEDDPTFTATTNAASASWKKVMDKINEKKGTKSRKSSVSGPEYFGYGIDSVVELLLQLPGADKLTKYRGAQKDKSKNSLSDSGKSKVQLELSPSSAAAGAMTSISPGNPAGIPVVGYSNQPMGARFPMYGQVSPYRMNQPVPPLQQQRQPQLIPQLQQRPPQSMQSTFQANLPTYKPAGFSVPQQLLSPQQQRQQLTSSGGQPQVFHVGGKSPRDYSSLLQQQQQYQLQQQVRQQQIPQPSPTETAPKVKLLIKSNKTASSAPSNDIQSSDNNNNNNKSNNTNKNWDDEDEDEEDDDEDNDQDTNQMDISENAPAKTSHVPSVVTPSPVMPPPSGISIPPGVTGSPIVRVPSSPASVSTNVVGTRGISAITPGISMPSPVQPSSFVPQPFMPMQSQQQQLQYQLQRQNLQQQQLQQLQQQQKLQQQLAPSVGKSLPPLTRALLTGVQVPQYQVPPLPSLSSQSVQQSVQQPSVQQSGQQLQNQQQHPKKMQEDDEDEDDDEDLDEGGKSMQSSWQKPQQQQISQQQIPPQQIPQQQSQKQFQSTLYIGGQQQIPHQIPPLYQQHQRQISQQISQQIPPLYQQPQQLQTHLPQQFLAQQQATFYYPSTTTTTTTTSQQQQQQEQRKS